MIIIVHGIWILLRYFIRSVTKKDTVDKATQVEEIVLGGFVQFPEHIDCRTATEKKDFDISYSSNSCPCQIIPNGQATYIRNNKEDLSVQSSRNKAKMAEGRVNFSEIRKNAPVNSTWLMNAKTSTNEMKDWLENIELTWFDPSITNRAVINGQVADLLTKSFVASTNPYVTCIYLLEHCRDFYTGKTTTLTFFIMKEFERWVRHCKKKIDDLLTQDVRLHAFLVATERHMTLFDMAVKAFKLTHLGNEYFLPEIRKILEKGKHKEACHCAGKLGLQHHFTMEEIVLPLILQDKVNMVESYVIGKPEQQRAVVQLLDHLCDRETDINVIIDRSHVENVKRDKLQKKTLSKLAVRLMKLYQIPAENCPNISNARGLGALKYLMYKRYIEKTFGSGSWDEMVKSAVGENSYLKEQLVDQLMWYNDHLEAAKWANIYQLPDDKIPSTIRDVRERLAAEAPIEGASGGWGETGEENWDDDCFTESDLQKHYHNLSLSAEHISVVDTRDKLSHCVHRLSQPETIIGIDSEWRPAFAAQQQRVALMQFAVKEHVFLVDCVALRSVLTDQDWADFTSAIFCSQDTVKLGYGLESDLVMLIKSFPSMKEPLLAMKRVVNIDDVSKQIFGDGPVLLEESAFFSDEESSSSQSSKHRSKQKDAEEGETIARPFTFAKREERGLSELVRQCLGKPLCKVEQMSDWEKRPLRQAQMVYAALDAYVLLEVYSALQTHVRQNGLSVDLEPPVCTKWSRPSKNDKKKAKAAGKRDRPPMAEATVPQPRSGSPISPYQLRVVVDTMLQGLGKQLRSCGVDVYILEANDDHEKTIMICKQQGRIVLSNGNPYKMIRSHVGDSMCYNVLSHKASDQTTEVLTFFNVKVTQEDIFSRCQVCNGAEYIEIPTKDLKQLYDRKVLLEAERSHVNSGHKLSALMPSDGARFLQDYGIDWSTVTIATTGSKLQVEAVHKSKFDTVDWFFCCAKCGKVFWEGSHFSRVCEQFSHVLTVNDNRTVYDNLRKDKQ